MLDHTVDTGDFAGVLRLTGFEELRHPGKTTGDVLGFGSLTWCLRDRGSGLDLVVVLDGDK